MLYTGTVILKKSDEHFWKLTPREFTSLVSAHIKANTPRKHKRGYIDDVL